MRARVIAFYRALLRLYPASFRADYRSELMRTFEERVRGRSALGAAMVAGADVLPNALAAHAELLRQDLTYAGRSFRHTPGFAITAILVVALGVGANTASFALADFVFLRPFPYPESDRLVKLYQAEPTNEWNYGNLSPGNFRDWKEQQRSFTVMGAHTSRPANLVSLSEPRRVEIVRTTPDVLPLLGVRPILGRLFTPDDTLTGQAIVLSHALWQSQFGGDVGVVGEFVRLDGVPHAVVGVMPASFRYPNAGADAWAPLVFTESDFADRRNRFLEGIARLRPGVTREQARADLNRIAARLTELYPQEAYRTGAAVFHLRGEMSMRARELVIALCGAALCILLLACANLASLFLVRGAHRSRELAVRAALGAGRERLVRQLVTESLALALVGGVLGIAVAAAGVPLLARLVPAGLPMAPATLLDARVLALAAALMLLTGMAFGMAPAMLAGRSGALEALRSGARAGGGRTQRVRAGLVVVEVGACVVLLIASGLLIRAVWRVQAIDPGFTPEQVLTVRTALPLPRYDSTARRLQFYERVLEDVRALPGVQSAGYMSGVPLVMRGGIRRITLPGRDELRDGSEMVSFRYVTSQYFAALGIPLRRGRDVAAGDTRDALPVAVVSESFVQRHWPGRDPIGERFIINEEERVVVGVVGDVHVRGLERPSEPQVYVPAAQMEGAIGAAYTPQDLVVRAAATPTALIPQIRAIVRAADSEQPISNVRLLADIVGDETAPRVTQLCVLVALSAIALLIAGLGIHGLLTFTVTKRTPELGVRRALGAPVGDIVGLVLREGLILAATGIAAGVAVAWAAAHGMSALLVGVRPEDPLTIASAALLCLVTVILACVRPAMRAARVDPMFALRSE